MEIQVSEAPIPPTGPAASTIDPSFDGAAPSKPARQTPPPVIPNEMLEEFEKGELFSDPELSSWWWNSHDFLTNQQRLDMVTKIVPLCTSIPCKRMFISIRGELQAYLGPVSTTDAVFNGLRRFISERPVFSAAIGTAMAYLLILAGMNLFGLIHRVTSL